MSFPNSHPRFAVIASPHITDAPARYELCFRPLDDARRACSFPCDADGLVDMDALGERARNAYLYARTVIGRGFAMPRVQPCIASDD
jgi:hypothetical protein